MSIPKAVQDDIASLLKERGELNRRLRDKGDQILKLAAMLYKAKAKMADYAPMMWAEDISDIEHLLLQFDKPNRATHAQLAKEAAEWDKTKTGHLPPGWVAVDTSKTLQGLLERLAVDVAREVGRQALVDREVNLNIELFVADWIKKASR